MLCRRIYCWRQRFSILNTFYSVTCASVGTWRKVGWPCFPSLNAFISAQSCFSWVWLKLPWRCLNKSDQRDWGKVWSILLWWEWVCVCARAAAEIGVILEEEQLTLYRKKVTVTRCKSCCVNSCHSICFIWQLLLPTKIWLISVFDFKLVHF